MKWQIPLGMPSPPIAKLNIDCCIIILSSPTPVPLGHQPRSQVLSPTRWVGTGRREPWERGCSDTTYLFKISIIFSRWCFAVSLGKNPKVKICTVILYIHVTYINIALSLRFPYTPHACKKLIITFIYYLWR